MVVGVAWRPNMESQSFKATCLALEEAGIRYVVLDQALSADLRYDGQNKLLEGVAETGALTPEAAKLVRCNTWQGRMPTACWTFAVVIGDRIQQHQG